MPSEASVKFFDETFFQKSFDLALDLSGRQPEKKLGKQPGNLWLPAPFPDGSAVALSVTAAAVPALPKGEPSLASPFGGGAPAGGGEGTPPPPRTCAILLMSTSGSELPLARIESPGTGPQGRRWENEHLIKKTRFYAGSIRCSGEHLKGRRFVKVLM